MVELGPPLPSQLCFGPGNEASWTLGKNSPSPYLLGILRVAMALLVQLG